MGKGDGLQGTMIETRARSKAVRNVIYSLQASSNVLEDLSLPTDLPSTDDIQISYLTSTDISATRVAQNNSVLLNWMLYLTERNMRKHYERCPGWGWKTEEKLKELEHKDARFLVLHREKRHNGDTNRDSEGSSNLSLTCNSSCFALESLLGFAHIRFETERQLPILYLYEIQIDPNAQGRGLGRALMKLIEDLASKAGLSAVLLTVFKSNKVAKTMYESLGYCIHESSPDEDGESGYLIFSKLVASKRTKMASTVGRM